MDNPILAALRFAIALGFALLVLLLAIGNASAQSGACPSNFLLAGNVSGFYPDDVYLCSRDFNAVFEADDTNDHYPCDQLVAVEDLGYPFNWGSGNSDAGHSVVVVPDSSVYYGQIARLRFYVFPQATSFSPPGTNFADGDIQMSVNYVSSAGNWTAQQIVSLNDYPRIATYYTTSGINHYYQVHIFDLTIQTTEGSDGYFLFQMWWDSSRIPYHRDWWLSGLQIGAAADSLPEMCPIPNANTPATAPAPTVVGTSAPTWTPHATPSPVTTPGATAVGGTPYTTPTPTAWYFPTLQSESTPTPWPPLSIPTVRWPTPDLTVIPAAVTSESLAGDLIDQANQIVNDWGQVVDFAEQNSDTTITTTTGFEAPNTIAQNIMAGLSIPIAYAKGAADYMPVLAPYVAILMGFASWVIFNLAMQYIVQAVVFVLEVIRRLWEMIPFN